MAPKTWWPESSDIFWQAKRVGLKRPLESEQVTLSSFNPGKPASIFLFSVFLVSFSQLVCLVPILLLFP
jgi:hypothetical protein